MITYKKAVVTLQSGRKAFKGKNINLYKNGDGLFELYDRISETETVCLIIFSHSEFCNLVYSRK